ncbi:MAG: glycerate kinase [Acidimicrobiales bacterium]
MPHLVAAPDKYRGTATAAQVAGAMVRAALARGWTADAVPMADGGEGTLEALAPLGVRRVTPVLGPLGRPVAAEWLLLAGGTARRLGSDGPTAVVEAAQAVGRALLPVPRGDDPLRATTAGVGELIMAAADAGATTIVVAVGGTATTDGGSGAVAAIGGPDRLRGARLVVACDVTTRFAGAAATFAPQKGASPAQVDVLARRLAAMADRCLDEHGVNLDRLAGAGAGGGLAGGLAALGGRLVAGYDLVARAVDLPGRLATATAVATGEGRLDATSFEGKVVGGVAAAAGRVPVVCLPGSVAPGTRVPARYRRGPCPLEVHSLTDAVGEAVARTTTASSVATVLGRWLDRWPPAGP